MHRTVITFFVALAVGSVASAALAQQAPASDAPVPRHNCTKPSEYPGNLASDNAKRSWQKDYVTYTDCLKKFITDEQALARPHVKASDDAIAEYNAGVKAYNAEVEKAKGNN